MSDISIVISYGNNEEEITVKDDLLISDLKARVKELFHIEDDVSNIQLEFDDSPLDDDDEIEMTEIDDGDTIICTLKTISLRIVYNTQTYNYKCSFSTSFQDIINNAADHFHLNSSSVNLFNNGKKLNPSNNPQSAELPNNAQLDLYINSFEEPAPKRKEKVNEDDQNDNLLNKEDVNIRKKDDSSDQSEGALTLRVYFPNSPQKMIIVEKYETFQDLYNKIRRLPEGSQIPEMYLSCSGKRIPEDSTKIAGSAIEQTPVIYVNKPYRSG